jgi:hypothetical protein
MRNLNLLHRCHPEQAWRKAPSAAEGPAVAFSTASIRKKMGAPGLDSETWESYEPQSGENSRATPIVIIL